MPPEQTGRQWIGSAAPRPVSSAMASAVSASRCNTSPSGKMRVAPLTLVSACAAKAR